MGKRKKTRRKSSDDSLKDEWVGKKGRRADSEDNESVDLSGVLKDANSVVYGGESDDDDFNQLEPLLEAKEIEPGRANRDTKKEKMAESVPLSSVSEQPSNADIMKCLTAVHKRLDLMNENMSSQSRKLDQVNEKIGVFENELKKLWTHLHDAEKKTNERLGKVEECVESADFNLTMLSDKVAGMEKREGELMNEIVYLQSQSMRNNLIFSRIPEMADPSASGEDTEKVIREFLVQKMKIANELVQSIQFDRVHRMGQRREGRCRNIVARFTLFKEREMVRRQSSNLKGTGHAVFEQFPREINEKRKKLVTKMNDEKKKGNKAWISYDTLFVNGRPVKDTEAR